MVRKIFLVGASAAALSLMAAASAANATTIDFSTYALYTPITTVGDATFSLQGGPATGTPVTGSFGSYGVGNSPTGNYPTSTVLDVAFGTPVSNVTFTFDNFGTNFASTATAYDAHGNMIATDHIGSGLYSYSFANGVLGGGGIADVKFDNGTNGNCCWEFAVGKIGFNDPVPEPASWTLMVGGLGFLGFALRRRNPLPARAA